MSNLLLCMVALTSVTTPVELPRWYAGRHAVLVVVDGLGDGALDVLAKQGLLKRTRARYIEKGARAQGAAALWPSRGVDEARSVARGQRLTFESDASFAAPGIEAWPVGSYYGLAGQTEQGLAALLTTLSKIGKGHTLPVLAVVHEQRYGRAVLTHGGDGVQARQALQAIDRDLSALAQIYRVHGLWESTLFALVSPSGVRPVGRRIDAAALFKPLLLRAGQRSSRVASLLGEVGPLRVQSRGGLAFLALRETSGALTRNSLPVTRTDMLRAARLGDGRGRAAIKRIAASKGVAFVVTREQASTDGAQMLVVTGRHGIARLELRPPAQLRYSVLSGKDPLGLEALARELGADRFHDADVWRYAAKDMPDAPARLVALLSLVDRAALVVVTEAGFAFDEQAIPAGTLGRAEVLLASPTPPTEPLLAVRTIDVMPTLLAHIGAPLSADLDGTVLDEVIDGSVDAAVQSLCRQMVRRAADALTTDRDHDPSVLDTSELRRFGHPPPYFGELRRALLAEEPLRFLPELSLRRQIGARRSLLHVATTIAGWLESQVVRVAPTEIRRFDSVLQPALILTGFLDDPQARAHLRVIEGPLRRARSRAGQPQ